MGAALEGHRAALEVLISRNANVRIADDRGMTALMAAASRGHTEIARDLLQAGAPVDSQNDEGRTALMLAVSGIWLGTIEVPSGIRGRQSPER